MSKYTTELRFIVENIAKEQNLKSINSKIEYALPNIFNFDFPIFDETHRIPLETKIIHHYYFREIAFETVGLWKEFLNIKLNEIMPFYNQLYATLENPIDYLNDINITEISTKEYQKENTSEYSEENTLNANTQGTNQTVNNLQQIDSDLPQATESLAIGSDYYANYIKKNTGNVQNTVSSNDSNTGNRQGNNSLNEDFRETNSLTRKGIQGGKSPVELLTQYRDSLLNIDLMIINDLAPLFFTLY